MPPAQKTSRKPRPHLLADRLSQPELGLQEVIGLIEKPTVSAEKHRQARALLSAQLAGSTDPERSATLAYYILRLHLDTHFFREDPPAKKLYDDMLAYFQTAEREYHDRLRSAPVAEHAIIRAQIDAFYRLVDSYLRRLAMAYTERGFVTAAERAHADEMRFRRRHVHFEGRHLLHLGHWLLEKTSNYGQSFLRWGITVVIAVVLFGAFFWALDFFDAEMIKGDHPDDGFLQYFYFSLITFMTVGYGDITPAGAAARLLAGAEAVTGYIMLGLFLTLIQKRI